MALVELMGDNPTENRIYKRPKFVLLDIDDIIPNELNDAPINNIEELMESLKEDGLMKPLEVYNYYGKYKLIGGERRYTALKKLIDNNEFEPEVMCLLYNFPENIHSDTIKMAIIQSNAQRPSKEHILQDTKSLLAIYDNLEIKPKGLKRQWIAKKLGISERTVQNYIAQLEGKNGKNNKKELPLQYQAIRKKLEDYFDTKCTITESNKITINCVDINHLNTILEKLGLID